MFRLSFFDVPKLFCIRSKEFHRESDVAQIAAFDWKITRFGGTTAKYYGIEVFHQLLGGNVFADFDTASDGDTFGFHQLGTASDDVLLQFHVRDTIHEESTWPISAFVNGDEVPGFVQLVGCGETRWS